MRLGICALGIVVFIGVMLTPTKGQNDPLVMELRKALKMATRTCKKVVSEDDASPGNKNKAKMRGRRRAPGYPYTRVHYYNSPQNKLDLFSNQQEDPYRANAGTAAGQLFEIFSRSVQHSIQQKGTTAVKTALENPRLKTDIQNVCERYTVPRKQCVRGYRYRVPDGTCNHPDVRVTRGASLTPQPRILPSAYETVGDKNDLPRSKGKYNQPLRSAREISNVVFSTTPQYRSPMDTRYSLTLVHFGQFVDHDIIATPSSGKLTTQPDGTLVESKIENCDRNCDNPIHEECFPIRIPIGDNNFLNNKCMHFVRRKPAPNPDCTIGPRQQRNDRTSFVDLSVAYGSSEKRYRELREFKGGRLNSSKGNLLPFGPAVDDCLSDVQKCFNSGDDRHQEVPMLTVFHIVFMREHNNIADGLSRINPRWDDEKVFQEAKKILTGIYQHIVYNEFLPVLMGTSPAYYEGLLSGSGHRNVYKSNVDPGTLNEFGVAAFRFGHTLAGRFVNAMDLNLRAIKADGGDLMRHDFFNNSKIVDRGFGPSGIGQWMAYTPLRRFDRFISDELRNHLFEDPSKTNANGGRSDGFDLAAFNIHRGRDHGIPGYNQYRRWCGLQPAYSFTSGGIGFRNHDAATVAKLARVYDHPDDVELFVGGVSEIPDRAAPNYGGILGPLFSCIIGKQFRRYKEGDRFWYENPFSDTGFTTNQLNDIKRQKFSGLYCRTLGLNQIQVKAFERPSSQNHYYSCNSLPKPNLELWRDPYAANPIQSGNTGNTDYWRYRYPYRYG